MPRKLTDSAPYRRNLASVALLSVLFACISWAQETVLEPEFPDVFFGLDAGKLVPLERQAMGNLHAGAFGGKYTAEFPGGKSPVRFRSGDPLEFVIRRVADSDPAGMYHLRTLMADKKKRQFIIMSVHLTSPFSATAKFGASEGDVPTTYSRYGASSIKMAVSKLPVGEYALGISFGGTGQAMFCFGVD